MGLKRLIVVYKNWKGRVDKRTIIPLCSYWGHTEFHKEDQFLLKCIDVEKKAERTYAMKDIIKIEAIEQGMGSIELSFKEK